MKRTSSKAGFTLIELMIVVAIIAIIAAVAIPKLISARVSANENAAIATLRSIAAAQQQLQASSAIDTDADGGGEYGFFGELAGVAALRFYDSAADAPGIGPDLLDPPILPTAFGDIVVDGAADGVTERQGYFYKMWLPDVTALGLTGAVAEAGIAGSGGAAAASLPDSDNCEILWACYAWPVDAGKTGNRAFFVNQRGDVTGTDGGYSATTALDASNAGAAFEAGGSITSVAGNAAVGSVGLDGNRWVSAR